MIGIAPAVAVSFLSRGWSGKLSDKEITNRSNFYDFLQNGGMVMADCGFTIEEDSAARDATLKIPAFTENKKQMSAEDVHNSRKTSNARIHVERVESYLVKVNNRDMPNLFEINERDTRTTSLI